MLQVHDVVIVGAGLLGLAAGRALARQGRDVVLLDRESIGHADGGSKGSCRVFRFGYDDPLYVELVRQARPLWRELEHEAGQRLLHPTPQLTFGRQMPAVQAAMSQAGAPCQVLSPAEASERFPGVTGDGPVLLEPDSAVIAADLTLAAMAAAVGDIRTGTAVLGLADDGRQVTVSTAQGDIGARCAIVCAGPWTAGLLAGTGIRVPGSATSEQVAYLAPIDGVAQAEGSPQADGAGQAAGLPIFIHHGDEIPYGLPVPGSQLYKVGMHHDGAAVDPDRQDHEPDAALAARIARAAKRFLPGLDPVPVGTERCVYDNSPDTDFIVDRIGNVVIGSGTSGHGFKFGPLFGAWLAALTEPGATPPGLPQRRFSLGRPSLG